MKWKQTAIRFWTMAVVIQVVPIHESRQMDASKSCLKLSFGNWRYVALAIVGLIGIIILGVAGLPRSKVIQDVETAALVPVDEKSSSSKIKRLILDLYDPDNKADLSISLVPGGEIIGFSKPMIQLVGMGTEARTTLHEYIQDEAIRNEVVLILGAVGDESTVKLLIDTYPTYRTSETDSADSSRRTEIICYTYALTYLTGVPIGRSRLGTDFDPNNKSLWTRWWQDHSYSFTVSSEKPAESWVPNYRESQTSPSLAESIREL